MEAGIELEAGFHRKVAGRKDEGPLGVLLTVVSRLVVWAVLLEFAAQALVWAWRLVGQL